MPIGAPFTIEVSGGSIVVTRLGVGSAKCNGCDHKFAKHSYHISQIRQHGGSCLRKAATKDAAAEAKQEGAAAKSAAYATARAVLDSSGDVLYLSRTPELERARSAFVCVVRSLEHEAMARRRESGAR